MSKNKTELKRLYDEKWRIHEEIIKWSRKAFPKSSVQHYMHGGHVVPVTVIEHNRYCARVKVRGKTGSEYWIDCHRLLID